MATTESIDSREWLSDMVGSHVSDSSKELTDALERMINDAAKAEKFLIDHIKLLIATRWLPWEFDYIDKWQGNFVLSFEWDEFEAKIIYKEGKSTYYIVNSDEWQDTYYFKNNVLIHKYLNTEDVNPEEKIETPIDNQDIIEAAIELWDYPWWTYTGLDLREYIEEGL